MVLYQVWAFVAPGLYSHEKKLVLPLVKWLQGHGVKFQYGTEVTDVDFALQEGRKQATRIHWTRDGQAGGVDLGADDLLFMTIGSLTENSDNGDHHTAARVNEAVFAGADDHGRPLK